MIDGARTKIRKTKRKQKGQGKSKTQKRRYRTDWREPKLFTLYLLDPEGKVDKELVPLPGIVDPTVKTTDRAI